MNENGDSQGDNFFDSDASELSYATDDEADKDMDNNEREDEEAEAEEEEEEEDGNDGDNDNDNDVDSDEDDYDFVKNLETTMPEMERNDKIHTSRVFISNKKALSEELAKEQTNNTLEQRDQDPLYLRSK
ncbi:hypothetical protein RFI_37156, partial [Reticulomyxa filosa]